MRRLLTSAVVGTAVLAGSVVVWAQGSGVPASRTLRFGRDSSSGSGHTYSRFEAVCERGTARGQTCMVEWKELKDWGICIYATQDWGEVQFRWVDGRLRSEWLLPGGRTATRSRLRRLAGARVVRFHLTADDKGQLAFINELGNVDASGTVSRLELHPYTLRDSAEAVPVRCRTASF